MNVQANSSLILTPYISPVPTEENNNNLGSTDENNNNLPNIETIENEQDKQLSNVSEEQDDGLLSLNNDDDIPTDVKTSLKASSIAKLILTQCKPIIKWLKKSNATFGNNFFIESKKGIKDSTSLLAVPYSYVQFKYKIKKDTQAVKSFKLFDSEMIYKNENETESQNIETKNNPSKKSIQLPRRNEMDLALFLVCDSSGTSASYNPMSELGLRVASVPATRFSIKGMIVSHMKEDLADEIFAAIPLINKSLDKSLTELNSFKTNVINNNEFKKQKLRDQGKKPENLKGTELRSKGIKDTNFLNMYVIS